MASTSCVTKSPLPMKETALSHGEYPPAMATYEEVVDNPKLFMLSLEKLHALMCTKF
ncbi:high mobility group B protein 15-like, partial [Trifolium pratense]